MSEPALGTYTFLPWVRRGLARSIPVRDEPGDGLVPRVRLPVTVHVEGAGDVPMHVRLNGPGDVTGLSSGQVVRTDPRPGTTSFEANYLAAIEFAHVDLPWLFTPAAPNTAGHLRPWLVLVVVRRGDGVRLEPHPAGPLPVLDVRFPARPADELPDLSQSWAWAHGQITGTIAGQTAVDVLRTAPGRTRSRLVCPRRLEVSTAYLACLVPAFLAGVQAGLGEPVADEDESPLLPAWSMEDMPDRLRLPVYHSWEFATGLAGTFETLVRLITPRPLPPDAVRLDVSTPGGGLPDLDPTAPGAIVEMDPALRIPRTDDEPPPWPSETRVRFQAALEHLLTTAPEDTITAPVYGQTDAGAGGLPGPGPAEQQAWVRELNLDPRLRAAAAAGTRVVQDRQEQLMADAWDQAGALREANTVLRQAQLARELGVVVLERHFQSLSPEALLAITQPAQARVQLGNGTLQGELRASRLPEAASSGALRRLLSTQGPLLRRAMPAERRPPLDVVAALDRAAVAPPPPAPAGMVTLADSPPPAPTAALRPPLSPESVQARLLERLRPERTVLERAKARLQAPPETWERPDPLAEASLDPTFEEPMYEGLRDVAPELFVPALDQVPANTAALLETSPPTIEAYMVGLNHEMRRELLWREFPADLASTPFRQFWDVRGQRAGPGPLEDIPPLSEWGDRPLGQHLRRGPGGSQLVLLVRGELLRRYPTTTIYAAPATPVGELDPATRLPPIFRGFMGPDVTFVGFPLSEDAVRGIRPAGPGWYFVFEEHPGEPRFGFDEEAAKEGTPVTPDDLAWVHVPLNPSGHVDLARPLSAAPDLRAAWGRDAPSMARLTLQKPFRVAIHATALLGGEVDQ